MEIGKILIEKRFLGPPRSANGGYACGRLAAWIDGPAEVTLRRPPPLETGMTVHDIGDGDVELRHGSEVIAAGRPCRFRISSFVAPTFDEASVAAARTFDESRHPLPTCFVCGPHRAAGDGLRIHVGPLDPGDEGWTGLLAAPWIPDASLADDSGTVRPEFIWAALDCPTAYASSDSRGMRIILLGRQAVRIHSLPKVRSRCVVTARQTGQEGRKYFAESALFDDHGSLLAECRATWIEVSREVQQGLTG